MTADHPVDWGRTFADLRNRFAERAFVRGSDGARTYREILDRAGAAALTLVDRGVRHGEPVATLLPNGPDVVAASIGVTLAGAAEVSLHAGYTRDEIARRIALLGIRHVVTDRRGALALPPHCAAIDIEDIVPRPWAPQPWMAPRADRWGRILFTSGSTGQPKGVVHTHGGRWLANMLLRAHLPFQPEDGDDLLLMTPFGHGASLLTYAFMATGAAVTLLRGVATDVVGALLRARAVNAMFAPPTVLAKIVSSLEGERIECLRTIFCGTATLPRALWRDAVRVFGPIVRITYGMTEIFNPITVLDAAETADLYDTPMQAPPHAACVGWPATGVSIDVRGDAGEPRSHGEPGHIHVRAPHAFAGYVTSQGFEARVPTAWHSTGDVGYLDAVGRLWFAGRSHDVLKTGGYRVAPEEIEDLLIGAIGAPIAIVGLPSSYWGDVLVAVAERPASDWTRQAERAVQRLSAHKRPRAYVAVDDLSRNAIGKLDRTSIVAMVLRDFELRDGSHPSLVPRAKPDPANT